MTGAILTLNYVRPLTGTRRKGGMLQAWSITRVDAPVLPVGALPPDDILVNACHNDMRDDAGNKVAPEILRTYDLQEGLAAAFRALDETPEDSGLAAPTKEQAE